MNWARWVSSWSSTHVRNSSGSKPKRCLEAGQVRPDEVDAPSSAVPRSTQQVVLTEHAAAHPPEQRAELGAGDLAGHADRHAVERLAGCRWSAFCATVPASLEQRVEQLPERGDVGADPGGPVDHVDRAAVPPAARSPVVGLDLVLRLGGAILEPRRSTETHRGRRGDRRRGARPARRAPSRSATARRGRVAVTEQPRSLVAALRLPGYCWPYDLLQVAADQTDDGHDRDPSEEQHADPPVPDVRSEHGVSVATRRPERPSSPCRGQPIWPSPSRSSPKHCSIRGQQAGRHLVVPALRGDHDAAARRGSRRPGGSRCSRRGGRGSRAWAVLGQLARRGRAPAPASVSLQSAMCSRCFRRRPGSSAPVGRRMRAARASAKSYNRFCIAFLPRCSRDITVPIGMSSISAISL